MTVTTRHQFLGFIFAGGIATALNYGLYLLALNAGTPYLLAATLGYLSGIAVSYSLNRRYIYASKAGVGPELIRYLFAYLGALCGQLALLESLIRFGLGPDLSNLIAIALVVILNFFVIRRFVFDENSESRKD